MTRRNTALRLAALAVLALVSSACQSGLGSVPSGLVQLYDEGDEAGLIEIEIHRNGLIREMEADIPVDALPANVLAAARARAPGMEITGAEHEIKAEGSTWEVKFRLDGRDWEYVLDAQGNILESEMSLSPEEAPEAVLRSAEAAIPDSSFKSVERIEDATGHVEYHVKRTRNGASYKVVMDGTGRVLRKVREHRAEIEIPLRD